jgi:hypothetical protein
MSPVERLQAAIDKLEQMRTDRGYVEVNGWLAEENPGDTARSWLEPRDDLSPITNDELIVTLYRTIDAQLAVLRDAHERYSHNPEKEPVSPSGKNAVALADAILNQGAADAPA